MPHSQHSPNTSEDPADARIGQILNDFLDRRARGEAVSENELFAEFPEFADELRDHLELLGDLKPARENIDRLIAQGLLAPSSDKRYLAHLGPYKITELIGRGGMGIVLEAYEESLDRTVALKILRPELTADASALARFTREAKAAAALRHPNIVTVYAVGQEGSAHYIAMEHVNGPSLADVIREQGPLPAETIRTIFRQLLDGLAAAHDAGLIHRDIKPSNILLDGYPSIRARSASDGWHGQAQRGHVDGCDNDTGAMPKSIEDGRAHAPSGGQERARASALGMAPGISPPSQGGVGQGSSRHSEHADPQPLGEGLAGGSDAPLAPDDTIRAPSASAGCNDNDELRITNGERYRAPSASAGYHFTVKIADFGLARMMSSQTRMTLPDSLLGTPEYMSPEQARGDPNIDHRTDLYSAGVVLYEMLTGHPPFKADTPTAVIHQILNTDAPNPASTNKAADPELAGIARDLMAKDAQERPFTFGPSTIGGAITSQTRHRHARSKMYAVRLILACVVLVGLCALWPTVVWRKPPRIEDARPDERLPTRILVWYAGDADPTVFHPFPENVEQVVDVACVDCGSHGSQVIVAGLKSRLDEHGSVLIGFDPTAQVLWQTPLHSELHWPDSDTPRQEWPVRQIIQGEFDGRPGEELVVVAQDEHDYPSRISLIDPRTGDIRSTFWHFGHIVSVARLPDYFGDGRPALLARGYNNKLDGFSDGPPPDSFTLPTWDIVQVVMILDPLSMDGLGPPRTTHFSKLTAVMPVAYAFLDLQGARSNWLHVRVVDGTVMHAPPQEPPDLLLDNISHIGLAQRQVLAGDAPWLRIDTILKTDDDRIVQRGAPIFDRNLELCDVDSLPFPAQTKDETLAFWNRLWHPIIQNGRYVRR